MAQNQARWNLELQECKKQLEHQVERYDQLQVGQTKPNNSFVYGVCGSRNYRRIGCRTTDVKNTNAGPKLHCCLWEKSGFPAPPPERYFLAQTIN